MGGSQVYAVDRSDSAGKPQEPRLAYTADDFDIGLQHPVWLDCLDPQTTVG